MQKFTYHKTLNVERNKVNNNYEFLIHTKIEDKKII